MYTHLNDSLSKDLCHSAFRFIKKGIPQFYELESGSSGDYQTPTGNLAIAIELMLKALTAKISFHAIFKNVPQSLLLRISKGEPLKISERRQFENFDFKSILFNQAKGFVRTNYTEFSVIKNLIKVVREVRNKSFHSSLNTMEKFYLFRIFYLVVKLADLCVSKGCTDISIIEEKDRIFIEKIDNDKLDDLTKRINQARKKAESIDHFVITIPNSNEPDWDKMQGECSICRCNGEFFGDTNLVGKGLQLLIFKPLAFRCFECGLQLKDEYELDMLHYALRIRRDEDLGAYISEFGANPS